MSDFAGGYELQKNVHDGECDSGIAKAHADDRA